MVASAVVQGKKFEGEASSKKEAKRNAAVKILKELYNMEFPDYPVETAAEPTVGPVAQWRGLVLIMYFLFFVSLTKFPNVHAHSCCVVK